jgi:hypothetical protein
MAAATASRQQQVLRFPACAQPQQRAAAGVVPQACGHGACQRLLESIHIRGLTKVQVAPILVAVRPVVQQQLDLAP